ncbi:MAG TPA: hypothetical protein VE823_19755 [Geodermatophilus sp.]|jgi:hypothetical protein|nr:hypothetical protein [Geodermatophilus sp.]
MTTTRPVADTATPAVHHHRQAGRHARAAQQAIEANSTTVRFSLGDTDVTLVLPPLDKLAFYVGLAGAAAFGVIEWPIAVVTGVGHLLAEDRHDRTLHALGEALDAV